jgi:hypothetical protein
LRPDAALAGPTVERSGAEAGVEILETRQPVPPEIPGRRCPRFVNDWRNTQEPEMVVLVLSGEPAASGDDRQGNPPETLFVATTKEGT